MCFPPLCVRFVSFGWRYPYNECKVTNTHVYVAQHSNRHTVTLTRSQAHPIHVHRLQHTELKRTERRIYDGSANTHRNATRNAAHIHSTIDQIESFESETENWNHLKGHRFILVQTWFISPTTSHIDATFLLYISGNLMIFRETLSRFGCGWL